MAKGKKIPQELIDEIDRLRMSCSPPKIIKIMRGRVSPRSVYRILGRLREEDEIRNRELAEQTRRALALQEQRRQERARMRGSRPFRSVAQIPPRARVKAE
jgi:hypothetical protein